MVQPPWKPVWRFFNKLEVELPFDLTIPLLGIYTKELKSGSCRVISIPMFTATVIHCCQNVEIAMKTTYLPITREEDKENVVNTYNKILVSIFKK